MEPWPPAETKCKPNVRSLTSLQMFHTHAPLPWGFFGRSMADANEDSGHLGSDQLIKMPETKIQSVTIHKLKTT